MFEGECEVVHSEIPLSGFCDFILSKFSLEEPGGFSPKLLDLSKPF